MLLVLTKLISRIQLERLRPVKTWFPATWGEATPLGITALSAVAGLFKLSISDAEEEGDSPIKRKGSIISGSDRAGGYQHHSR